MAAGVPIGVVLAGGLGKRIGGDKAVDELAGRPLLLYPLTTLRTVVDEVAVVAKRDTSLPPLAGEANVWVEPDEPRHPLCGIVHALRLAAGRAVLVVAGDMALLDAGTLRAILATPVGEALAVVPSLHGRLEPLCALYLPAALGPLSRFDPSARTGDTVRALGIAILECEDDEPFFNVNAPEDVLTASALRARGVRAPRA
jgi:molybdopterin-guanine dinucleotide biosynthesis protein A